MMPVRKKNVAADCVQGAEEDGYGSGSYISAVMYIDGEKPIANPHDRNERHGVSVCRSLCPSVYGYRITFLGGGGHENI